MRTTNFSLGLAMLVGLLAVGCATQKVDWSGRLGTYTFDQAVLELGPPDKQATLTDGTLVADWLTRRGGVSSVPVVGYGYGPYCYGPLYPAYVQQTYPDQFLRLTFDPHGKLIDWRKFARY